MKNIRFEEILKSLADGNSSYINSNKHEFEKHISGQKPIAIVLTCSDSRVIPEYILNKKIGELFVIRVAGNVAMDYSVITSIEYAVSHLQTPILLFLGHTNCGAVKEAQKSGNGYPLLDEIIKGFNLDKDPVIGNLKYQYKMIFKRSKIVNKAFLEKKLIVKPAIYKLETGRVEFLDFD